MKVALALSLDLNIVHTPEYDSDDDELLEDEYIRSFQTSAQSPPPISSAPSSLAPTPSSSTTAPSIPHQCGYLIAIDIESNPDTHRLSQFGLSYIDLNKTIDTEPGQHGEEWHQYIRSRYFTLQHRNKDGDIVYICDMFVSDALYMSSMDNQPNVDGKCFHSSLPLAARPVALPRCLSISC